MIARLARDDSAYVSWRNLIASSDSRPAFAFADATDRVANIEIRQDSPSVFLTRRPPATVLVAMTHVVATGHKFKVRQNVVCLVVILVINLVSFRSRPQESGRYEDIRPSIRPPTIGSQLDAVSTVIIREPCHDPARLQTTDTGEATNLIDTLPSDDCPPVLCHRRDPLFWFRRATRPTHLL